MMLLGADSGLAKVHVAAPSAASKALFFTHGAANHASLEQVGDNVPRMLAPNVEHFAFLSEFGQIIVAHDTPLPMRLAFSSQL
jgi:hypothetical protein